MATSQPQFPHSSPDTLARDTSQNAPDKQVPALKASKEQANYRAAGSSSTNCGTCANYMPGVSGTGGGGTCKVVAGLVSPGGVSDLWIKRGPGVSDLISAPGTPQQGNMT